MWPSWVWKFEHDSTKKFCYWRQQGSSEKWMIYTKSEKRIPPPTFFVGYEALLKSWTCCIKSACDKMMVIAKVNTILIKPGKKSNTLVSGNAGDKKIFTRATAKKKRKEWSF